MRLLQLRLCEVIGPFVISACTLSLLCFCLSSFPLHAQEPPPLPGPDLTQNDGITELNRGPVHEGFAQPFQMKNGEGFLIDRQPPEPIQEIPEVDLAIRAMGSQSAQQRPNLQCRYASSTAFEEAAKLHEAVIFIVAVWGPILTAYR